jgi:hypothetical protein
MAIFDKQKKSESGQKPPSTSPLESPELFLQTVHVMANMLITNTAAMLGKVPHPESGQTFRSLESAELLIDLLQTLRDKAASKLPPEAQTELGRAISDLQMLYVQEASVSGDFSKANQMQKEAEAAEKAAPAPAASKPAPAPATSKPEPEPDHKEADEKKVKFSKKYE